MAGSLTSSTSSPSEDRPCACSFSKPSGKLAPKDTDDESGLWGANWSSWRIRAGDEGADTDRTSGVVFLRGRTSAEGGAVRVHGLRGESGVHDVKGMEEVEYTGAEYVGTTSANVAGRVSIMRGLLGWPSRRRRALSI